MNPLSFVSLSPLAYDTNYYIVHYLSNAVELQKTVICTKSIHFSCLSTYISTISLPTKIQTSITQFFFHLLFTIPPCLNRAAILQKTIAPHPSTIPSTNWDLDIMKNKHQNHTVSKFLLQTRCLHSLLSSNVEPTNIKQNKHTYIISNSA